MIALSIIDVKDFMNKLLIGEVFDRFFLVEASVTTFNTFTIDGRLQQDFFDTDTASPSKANELYAIAKGLSNEQLDNLIALAKGLRK